MAGSYKNCPIPLGNITRSIGVMLLERLKKWPDATIFAQRDGRGAYQPTSWTTFVGDISSIAEYLRSEGIRHSDRVATFSPNSYEMLVWEMAVTSMGATSVPIFAGYDVPNLDYILTHAEPTAVFIDGEQRLDKFKHCMAHQRIEHVVTRHESGYVHFDDCLKGGSLTGFESAVSHVRPNHVCFIQYTSGTTGSPKGVMLTHRNIMSQQKAISKIWDISHDSRFLSYLPWHHSFGGLFERFTALYQGGAIHLEDSYGKDFDRLLHNWSLVKPTQFFSVPKIYISLVTEAKLNPEIKEVLFHPELKFVFTAAAPLPKECGEYFQSQNVPVIEGWGLTETSPCVTLTSPDKDRLHSYVGHPIPGNEILTTAENEILVKGPNVMKGYFKDPERTSKAIDHYGWFRTGDLGEITSYGLRMICRIDGMYKLSNGEKVSSMMVENCLTISSRWIQHAVAIGAGEGFVGALVFPNFRNLSNWAKEQGKELPEGDDLATNKEIQELIAEEIRENLEGFQPKYMEAKAFVIIAKDLALEDGELTPTMKVIRHHVLDKYDGWVDLIYHPERHPEKQQFIVELGGESYATRWSKPSGARV